MIITITNLPLRKNNQILIFEWNSTYIYMGKIISLLSL